MKADEYKATMDQVTVIASMVQMLDLEAAAILAENALSIGHIVDPTRYRDGGAQNVEDALALLAPLSAFKHAAQKIREREAKHHTHSPRAGRKEGE